MGIRVIKPGLFTTVQDLGRRGYMDIGVPRSGAADPWALRAANRLLGNPDLAAGLEITLLGPSLELEQDTVAVLAGAGFGEVLLDGSYVTPGTPFFAPKGSLLLMGRLTAGCRGYLAVAGGIGVPGVLGSRSTYTRAALGGYDGRKLAAGDILPLGEPSRAAAILKERLLRRGGGGFAAAPFRGGPALFPAPNTVTATGGPAAVTVRALRGKDASRFAPAAIEAFFAEPYTVRPEADRMGARLAGPPLRTDAAAPALISEAVAPGDVQVPADGQPIVLLADCATAGGYPRIAHAASADLSLLAQLRPGDHVSFREITVTEAHRLLIGREQELSRLSAALHRWLTS